ncbi:M20 family metallopeptidase [Nitrospinota bacterium]
MADGIIPVPVDGDYVVALARELIRIPAENPPGDCSAIAERILSELKSLGAERIETHEFIQGMPNFIIQTGEGGDGGHFVIGSHMDTVPVHPDEVEAWEVLPFSGELRGGEIWGRGAADMKGALASVLGALKALRDGRVHIPGTLTWVLLSDGEHGDQNGAQALADGGTLKNLGGDMMLYTESTSNNIIRSFKGRIFFEVKVRGRSVHVSVPEKGINAIEKMARIVETFKAERLGAAPDPFLGPCTLTFSTIQGGSAVNVVGGRCSATFDVRMIPGQTSEGVMETLRGVLAELKEEDHEFDASLDIIPSGAREVTEIAASEPVVRLMEKVVPAVRGRSNNFLPGIESPGALRLFIENGIPGIFFGPGEFISEAHLPNERVPAQNLIDAAGMFATAARVVCGREAY